MNGLPPDQELPGLTDDQIGILDNICKAASRTNEPPIKAIFDAYDDELRARGLDSSHDNEIYRWILRVGESARRQHRRGNATNFVPYLRDLLEAHGITVVDTEGEDEGDACIEGITRSFEEPESARGQYEPQLKRRVSFDDARLDETYLSERSRHADVLNGRPAHGVLKQLPDRPGDVAPALRARSASASSSQPPVGSRQPALKHYHQASPSSDYASDYGGHQNRTLLFNPTPTQMDDNADAFEHISALKHRNRCFRDWHLKAHSLSLQRDEAEVIAALHDRRQLLRPCLEVLRDFFISRQEERGRLSRLEWLARHAQARRDLWIISKSFTHWARKTGVDQAATVFAQHQILRQRYFNRWRKTAVANALRARSLLCKKFMRLWREKAIRSAVVREKVGAQHEELLVKKYLLSWRRRCHDTWAANENKQRLRHQTMQQWRAKVVFHQEQERQAKVVHIRQITGTAFANLRQITTHRKQMMKYAEQCHDRKLAQACMHTLQLYAKLVPGAARLSLKINTRLKQCALLTWRTNFTMTRQASVVDRKRSLQTAWTTWNDALRFRTLAQRIDERVLRKSLSSWKLNMLAQHFRQWKDQRLLQHAVTTWHDRRLLQDAALEQASIRLADSQRRLKLSSAMRSLNIAVRNREDAERAATEFSNSRALPDVVAAWKQRSAHARQLAKWAVDARFYCLCTRTLKVWQERTIEHQHERRRRAYAQVRARVKARVVGNALSTMRQKASSIAHLRAEAEQKALARVFRVSIQGFNTWRDKAAQYVDLQIQATAADHQKLLGSAFSAVVNKRIDLSDMEQQVLLFRQESDLALLANVLKKVQWLTFTAARRTESADALSARNRDQHVKHMLRHWAFEAAKRKAAKLSKQQEPDSPSLRPASRVAARSSERPAQTTSPAAQTSTPAYMRTPSRSRRTGRFRSLPTPAHVTPMNFDPAYYVTTPAPMTAAAPGEEVGENGDVFDALTPQITPFSRKLRAGGVTSMPPSALRSSILGRSITGGGTAKSVRFASASRFGSGTRRLATTDE
ncbi:hypothetical protein DOTSEDRAFT_52126 [Dothistroma septosporum NZE10]|uniref:Sfi1 spindle body domain-containing protein n=1 Tax=Dothistroma septosporum (strain NZE10 / CBS 128990) TaxID=675120 RepID=N1PUT4_DOTSN|nr:hypothetical protein DOTSEDRAFT_52126 [Dothistroma septosporum NZE10]